MSVDDLLNCFHRFFLSYYGSSVRGSLPKNWRTLSISPSSRRPWDGLCDGGVLGSLETLSRIPCSSTVVAESWKAVSGEVFLQWPMPPNKQIHRHKGSGAIVILRAPNNRLLVT